MRQTARRGFGASLLLAGLLMSGCQGSPADPSLLARVGEVSITASRLRAFADKLAKSPGAEPREADHATHLQTLVDREILVLEARAQGLAGDREVRERLAADGVKKLAEIMTDSLVLKRSGVSEAEIAELYAQPGWSEQVVVLQVFVPTEAQADELMARLRAGEDFSRAAQAYAIDPFFKVPLEGPKQFVYAAYDGPREVVDVVFTIPAGGIVGSIPFRDGFVIAQVVERRKVGLEVLREGIGKAITREKRKQLREGYLRDLKWDLHFAIQPRGMGLAVDILGQDLPLSSLDEEQQNLPVYTYGEGSFSVKEVVEQLRSVRGRWAAVDQDTINYVLVNGVLPLYVMATDARRKGVDQTPDFLAWQREQEEDLIIMRLRKKVLDERLQVGEEDVKRYYEEHKERFKLPAQARVQELLVEDAAQARSLAGQLARGGDMAALFKQHSLRRHSETGILQVFASQAVFYGEEWIKAVMNAPLDQVQGPVMTKGGYSVFKVLERQPESFYPLTEKLVRQAVERDVRQEKSRAIFKQYLEELRQRYADRIEVYEENLKRLQEETAAATSLT